MKAHPGMTNPGICKRMVQDQQTGGHESNARQGRQGDATETSVPVSHAKLLGGMSVRTKGIG